MHTHYINDTFPNSKKLQDAVVVLTFKVPHVSAKHVDSFYEHVVDSLCLDHDDGLVAVHQHDGSNCIDSITIDVRPLPNMTALIDIIDQQLTDAIADWDHRDEQCHAHHAMPNLPWQIGISSLKTRCFKCS